MIDEGFLIYVSKPHLGCVGKDGEDDTDEDSPPREERESSDGIT
jgi:hypothetical protein